MICILRRFVAMLAAVMLAGCTATPPVPAPSASAAIAHDLQKLLAAVEAHHPDPWHGVDRATFTAAIDRLAARAAQMDSDTRLVEVMRLMALLTRSGREGHTGLYPWTVPGTHVYPIQLWHFPDGLHVVDAQEPYRGLVGARLTRIAGHPVEAVSEAVKPLIPRESDITYQSFGPMLHLQPEILHGLGLLPSAGPATIEVVHTSGRTESVVLPPISSDGYRAWLGRSSLVPRPDLIHLDLSADPLTLEWLESERTALLRYREIRGDTNRVAGALNNLLASRKVDRVIVDLRWNGGGNNHTYPPILNVLRAVEVDLYVLINRITFSAAANLATELDQKSSAIFVGEPTGGSPNLYADTVDHLIESFGLTVRIPTIYWQKSTPGDPRLAIEPDLPVLLTIADYLAGRDPVIAAVLDGK